MFRSNGGEDDASNGGEDDEGTVVRSRGVQKQMRRRGRRNRGKIKRCSEAMEEKSTKEQR